MTIDNRTPGDLIQEIARERMKMPLVDHNGRPAGEPNVYTYNEHGWPVKVEPTPPVPASTEPSD